MGQAVNERIILKIRQPSVQIRALMVGAGFPRPGRGDLAPTSFIADGLSIASFLHHKKVQEYKAVISSAEALRRRMKSPVTKGLGGEREG